MIYEIRNYYYEPSLLEDYRRWASGDAIDYLRDHLDVVGFWISGDVPVEVRGAPTDELGTANVTWIIRWPDLDTRHETMGRVLTTDEWKAIFAGNPGRRHYLRTEIKYAESL